MDCSFIINLTFSPTIGFKILKCVNWNKMYFRSCYILYFTVSNVNFALIHELKLNIIFYLLFPCQDALGFIAYDSPLWNSIFYCWVYTYLLKNWTRARNKTSIFYQAYRNTKFALFFNPADHWLLFILFWKISIPSYDQLSWLRHTMPHAPVELNREHLRGKKRSNQFENLFFILLRMT